MVKEIVEALNIKPDGIYVDATFGRGGHTRAILERLGPNGRVLAIDRDPAACRYAREWMALEPRLTIVQASFAELARVLEEVGLDRRITGIVLDLGMSSPQLDDPGRGFSFLRDGPLDMRMDPTSGESAAQWLTHVEEDELARVLRELGEERFARRIARAIIVARSNGMLSSTGVLARVVEDCVPRREPGKHPATRTFQAIRMHVNCELDQLESVLPQALEMLIPGGILVVVSFHSLEDRRVKRFLREAASGYPYPPELPITHDQICPQVERPRRARRPAAGEVSRNPRARSAVLRSACKSRGASP